MKNFTVEEIIKILEEKENGTPVRLLISKYAITENTYYRWKRKYGGMGIHEARLLRRLERDNRCQKKLMSDRMFDYGLIRNINLKNRKNLLKALDDKLHSGPSSPP